MGRRLLLVLALTAGVEACDRPRVDCPDRTSSPPVQRLKRVAIKLTVAEKGALVESDLGLGPVPSRDPSLHCEVRPGLGGADNVRSVYCSRGDAESTAHFDCAAESGQSKLTAGTMVVSSAGRPLVHTFRGACEYGP